MEHLPENNVEQANRSAAIPSTSLGRMLREARERLGLSVADVASQIKFAPRQIEALETDDFRHLPETAFLRGFVRSYAKILSLDVQILLAALPQAKTALAESIPASVEMSFPVAHSPQRQNLILLGAALLLAVIVLGFAVWHFTNPLKPPEVAKIEIPILLPAEMPTVPAALVPEPNLAAPSPVESKPRSPATAEPSSLPVTKPAVIHPVPRAQSTITGTDASTPVVRLRLVFDEEAWAEITDQEGKVISSKINPQGSELKLQRHAPLSLVIGHAKTTHLYRDDKPVDLTRYTNSSSEVARITLK